jgi:hypothetical protein
MKGYADTTSDMKKLGSLVLKLISSPEMIPPFKSFFQLSPVQTEGDRIYPKLINKVSG